MLLLNRPKVTLYQKSDNITQTSWQLPEKVNNTPSRETKEISKPKNCHAKVAVQKLGTWSIITYLTVFIFDLFYFLCIQVTTVHMLEVSMEN